MRRQRWAVLAVSTSLLSCLWVTPAAAAAQNLYLRGDGEPKATMSTSAPPSIALPDYDGDGPGRLVKKDGGGANQNDPTKYQQWSFDVSGQTVSVLNLKIWAAAKDFKGDKDVKFRAYLLDCGGSCSLIQQSDVVTVKSSEWRQVTVPFNVTNLSFESGRSLVVKITVVNDSDDDMWFAYGTSTYNAHLKVILDGPSPTTTTTSPTTTSTTQAAATTTTQPRATNNTAAPGGTGGSAGATTTTQAGTPNTTSAGATTTTQAGVSVTTAGIDVGAALGRVDYGEEGGTVDGEESGTVDNRGPGTETVERPTPVGFSAPTQSQMAALFETSRDLQPAEGLMVAFATAAETIALYWQAAVGLGSVAAVLVWRGLASGRDWESGDETSQSDVLEATHINPV